MSSVRSSDRDRITVKIHNMKRSSSRSPMRKRRPSRSSSSPERARARHRSPSYGSPPHHGYSSRGHNTREPPPPAERYSYKVLCVSAIHSKASDEFIKETLFREYKRFGEFSIRISHDLDERVAYVCFRSSEDAREAKHAKPRVVLYDKVAIVEPVYESASKNDAYRRSRPRSSSPPPEYERHNSYYANRSPEKRRPPPEHHYPHEPAHYAPMPHHPEPYHRPPIRHDYIPRGPRPYHHGPGGYRPPRHYVPRPYIPRPRLPVEKPPKKDDLPHYLAHIPPEDDLLATRTLFAGNLEINISDDELKRIFGKYGIVEDIDIKRPPPGTGNAFAFVKYQTLDMAARAKVELSGQYIGKFQCKIGYGKATPTTKVWIGGLGGWTSVTQLEREFDRFGAIKKIEYAKGDTYAMILYDSIDAASAAVKEMRGFPLGGSEHRLRLDYADDGLPQPTFKGQKPPFEEGGEYRKPPEFDYPDGEPTVPHHAAPEHAPAYHPPPHYAPTHYIPRYRGRGGYRGRGSYRGHNYNPHYDPHYRFHAPHGGPHDEPTYRPRGPPPPNDDYHHAPRRTSRSPIDRSRSRSPRRRSPEYDSDSPSHRTGALAQARTLPEIARKSSTVWQGALILKSSLFPAKLHLTDGDADFVDTLMKDENNKNHLRITQRLRLDQPKLDDVQKRINSSSSHAIFLGMPSSTASITSDDSSVQTRPLRNLVSYLKQKEAAGVISLFNKEEEITGVLYAFPPCDFSTELLKRTCLNVTEDSLKEDHLLIVVVRGGQA